MAGTMSVHVPPHNAAILVLFMAGNYKVQRLEHLFQTILNRKCVTQMLPYADFSIDLILNTFSSAKLVV
jgi:hypothetical protein